MQVAARSERLREAWSIKVRCRSIGAVTIEDRVFSRIETKKGFANAVLERCFTRRSQIRTLLSLEKPIGLSFGLRGQLTISLALRTSALKEHVQYKTEALEPLSYYAESGISRADIMVGDTCSCGIAEMCKTQIARLSLESVFGHSDRCCT